jgi:UDP-GlcNAc3NAcA epimerase
MKKVVTVIGARPQFVKAAVLSRIIKEHNTIEEVIIHTGQHFDTNMSTIFFEEMMIPEPTYNLEVNSMSHASMTGQMMEKIEKVLEIEQPEALIVYGDTNSTIAGALAAKKMNIKVVHVEAGLRSFNMKMPEEINRILTDRISDLLSCPSQAAIHNLKNEGYQNFPVLIENHGDIMKDAVSYYSQFSANKSSIIPNNKLHKNEFILATIHRPENTDDRSKLSNIFKALEEIHSTQTVILPLHPRTRSALETFDLQPNINLIDPVGYYDMLELLKNCSMVITDSGGLQKEAFFTKKQCIVVREQTEWVELEANGYAKVVGSNTKKIIQTFDIFKGKKEEFMSELYGNNVGEKIYQSIYKLIH